MGTIKAAAVVLLAVTLVGCKNPKETMGSIVGATAGGWAGSTTTTGKGRTAATVAGAVIGGLIGREVGRSLDRADRLHAERAAQRALEANRSGEASEWSNPDSGNAGTVTPTRTYASSDGAPCREYQQTITVGGRTVQGYGTACREADGSWRIVN